MLRFILHTNTLNCNSSHAGPMRKIPAARARTAAWARTAAHHAFGFSPPGRQFKLLLLPRRQEKIDLLGFGK
jgi:hypothetical protein